MNINFHRPLHITLVGCGSMGHAMLSAWLKRFDPETKFTVITPDKDSLKGLTDTPRLHWMNSNKILPFETDLIFFAVKPSTLNKILSTYINFKPQAYLSIAAGKPVSFYREILSCSIPFVRLMPNTPAAVGYGMTALYSADKDIKGLKIKIEALVETFGKFVWLREEEQFHAVTALSGSGPAYVFYLTETLEKAGIEMGLSPELANLMARQTVEGAGKYLSENPEIAPYHLRQKVTSKGGTTQAAFEILTENDSFQALITKALQAACKRSWEL